MTEPRSRILPIRACLVRPIRESPSPLSHAAQVPGGVVEMGAENFLREGRELLATLGLGRWLPPALKGSVGVKAPREGPDLQARWEGRGGEGPSRYWGPSA
jgi:hypothetical protein